MTTSNGNVLVDGLTNGHSTDYVITNGCPASKAKVANGHVKEELSLVELEFGTRAIHAGQEPSKWNHRAVIPPICLSTTYEQLAPAKPIVC